MACIEEQSNTCNKLLQTMYTCEILLILTQTIMCGSIYYSRFFKLHSNSSTKSSTCWTFWKEKKIKLNFFFNYSSVRLKNWFLHCHCQLSLNTRLHDKKFASSIKFWLHNWRLIILKSISTYLNKIKVFKFYIKLNLWIYQTYQLDSNRRV